MMDAINSYRDLGVWQNAMAVAEGCYRATKSFPRDELFGMTTQIRRSAASIPANIAEGYGRESTGSYIQFLRISQGSLKELETHLQLAIRVQIGEPILIEPILAQCDDLGKMLRGLIRSLETKP
jgi:four helix bundle protein